MTLTSLRSWMLALGFAAAVLSGTARAMGDDDDGVPMEANPDYAKAKQAIEAKDWNAAVELLARAAAAQPDRADIHNYLGYAERHRGNLDAAFKHYERALALDPKHRGAHEYVGEAYLVVGNLAKAEEHLAALDRLCFFPCHEYRELRDKIAEYKRKPK